MTSQYPPDVEKPQRYRAKLGGVELGPAELRMVPVDAIKLDSAYQRGTNRRWVNDHMPFDPKKASTLILSSRSGGPFCIDGGHRLEIAKASENVMHVRAYVIDGLTLQDEARLFTFLQRERRNLNSHDLFHADVASNDADTLAMVRIVTDAGFHLADKRSVGPNNITAIDACRWIQSYGGDALLAATLKAVGGLWVGYEKALSGQALKGVALFLRHTKDETLFRRSRFEDMMRANTPLFILGKAQENAAKRVSSSTSASDVAEAIRQQYNKRLPRESHLSPIAIIGKRRPAGRTRIDRATPEPVVGEGTGPFHKRGHQRGR